MNRLHVVEMIASQQLVTSDLIMKLERTIARSVGAVDADTFIVQLIYLY